MGEIAVNQNSTIILPVPIDLFKPFLESQNGSSSYGQEVRAARLEEEKEAERLYEEAVGEATREVSSEEVKSEMPDRGTQPLARKGLRSHSLSRLRAFILLGKAYPANDAPGVEIPGELALVFVARHEHDDAPIVDVLQIDGGRGTQIAREGLCGLDHHLLADPRFGDLVFRVRGAWPLPIHHSSLIS